MRYLIKLAAALGCALTLGWPALAAPSSGEAGREIRVAVENALPPLQFIDADGRANGLEHMLLAELATRLGLTLSYEVFETGKALAALQEGRADMALAGLVIRPDRADLVDFSTPYLTAQKQLLARSDETRFDSLESFRTAEGLRLGLVSQTNGYYIGLYDIFDGNAEDPRLVEAASLTAALAQLRAGSVDAVLVEAVVAPRHIAAQAPHLKAVGAPLEREDIAIAFPKGSALVAPVNAALGEVQGSGSLAALVDTWLYDWVLARP